MDALALGAAASVLITVILLFVLFYWSTMGGHDSRVRQRLDHVVNRTPVGPVGTGTALRHSELSGFAILGSLLSGREWSEKVALSLERADLNLKVGEYVIMRVAIGLLFFVAAFAVAGRGTMGLLAGVVAGLVGYLAPRLYVSRRIQSRLAKFNLQLVEALGLLANSLRSGFGLLQSMDLAAEQLDPPLSTEFKRTINDVNVGAAFEDALTAFNDRMKSGDLDIVITAILIQRTVGGNLAEVLDTVAHTMRERARIKGEIKSLTASQRMSGYVVGGLPLGIMGILFGLGSLLGQNYTEALFTTTAGRVALLGAAMLEGTGIMLIRRILKIEV